MPTSGATAPHQLCFEGMERPAKATWNPVPAKLERLKRYLEGYRANEREIFAKRAYIAARVGMKVRTLARYLRYLRETGWIETVRRTARCAIRRVLKALNASLSFGLSVAPRPLYDGYKSEAPPKKPSTKATYVPWRDGLHPDLLRDLANG